MKLLRTACAICSQNIRKWQTDQRIWMIAILMIIMVNIYVDDMKKISAFLGMDVPFWIFPFIYSQFHTKVIYTLGVVIMFCNAPFTDRNQIFVYTRCGRAKWLCGQILYIIFASALYYIFLFCVSFICALFAGKPSMEWGETLYLISESFAASDAGCPFVDIPSFVLDCFTPLQAVWFTFLTSWCSAAVLGLIIFFCNYVSQTQILGVLTASVIVILSVAIRGTSFVKFSPISWNTVDNIDVGGMTVYPSFTYCMCVYGGLIALLVAGILTIGRKKGYYE